jgi:hypothetical protein
MGLNYRWQPWALAIYDKCALFEFAALEPGREMARVSFIQARGFGSVNIHSVSNGCSIANASFSSGATVVDASYRTNTSACCRCSVGRGSGRSNAQSGVFVIDERR